MNFLQQLILRRKLDRDVDDEISEHIAEKAAELEAQGMPPAAALLAARREFGNPALTAEQSREVWHYAPVEELLADLRYALRQLRRAPAFAAAAIVTLALGIGANTAVFSVVNAVVLRPLPFPDSHRLVSVLVRSTQGGTPHPEELSYPQFFEFRKHTAAIEHLVSYHDTSMALSGAGDAVNVPSEIVSWDLFDALRVQPLAGRAFQPDDEAAAAHTVILGYQLWRAKFNADPSIVGRTVSLNREPYTVIGVAPRDFVFPLGNRDVQLWTTLAVDARSNTKEPMTEQAGARFLQAIARLRPGISIPRATAELDSVEAALGRQDPDNYLQVPSTWITPAVDSLVGDSRRPILILLGAVGLVLLVACANVANLLLARTAEREREFAVRASIGAGRGRIVRQLLTESFTLALAGSAAGILLAIAGVKAVARLAAGSIPRIEEASIDGRVLAFSIALAFVTTVLFSLAPAVRLARMELISPLKEAARGNAAGGGKFRSALVVFQIALGLVLVSGAGLLASSFGQLMRRDVGFRPDGLLTFSIGLPRSLANVPAHLAFESRVVDRLRTLPGVTDAALAVPLPLAGDELSISFNIEERPSAPSKHPVSDIAFVTPDYFRTVGIPLQEGRGFTENDNASSEPVLIVNRAFADKFFPGENAIGKRIEPGATTDDARNGMRQIVGIVANASQDALSSAPTPIYYYAAKQLPWCCADYVVRTTGSVAALASSLHSVVASIDPSAPVYGVHPIKETLSKAFTAPRFQLLLLGAFAAIALLLSAVGLYGVLAYAVLSRTREIGIRVALGANRAIVLRMVLRQAALLVAGGVAIGALGAIAGNRLINTIIYAPPMPQSILLTAAALILVITAAVAAIVPARRAAAVDPIQALRTE
jgi:putative ABC transport system permease protein